MPKFTFDEMKTERLDEEGIREFMAFIEYQHKGIARRLFDIMIAYFKPQTVTVNLR